MRTLTILAAAILFTTISVSAQNKTVYTSTGGKKCKVLESSAEEGGSYENECIGVGGYKIHVIEGDLRQTINVVTPKGTTHELNFWQFYGAFSRVGDTIEWRTRGNTPVAMIVRYFVVDPEDSTKEHSYLMVSRISEKMSCVTDVVEPMAKQNEKARELADEASEKPCMDSE